MSLDHPVKILWIDDEPKLLTQSASQLPEVFPGCVIDFASTLSVAVNRLSTTDYSVILLDIYNLLQDLDNIPKEAVRIFADYHDRVGLAFSQIIRTGALGSLLKPELNRIPIIVTSGFSQRAVTSGDVPMILEGIHFFPKSRLVDNPLGLAAQIVSILDKDDPQGPVDQSHPPGKVDFAGTPALSSIAGSLAKVLHDNVAEFIAARAAVQDINKFFGPNPFTTQNRSNGLEERFHKPINRVVEKVRQLKNFVANLPESSLEDLRVDLRHVLVIADGLKSFKNELLTSNLRDLADGALDLGRKLQRNTVFEFPSCNDLQSAAQDLKCLLCQYDLHQMEIRMEEMLQQAELLSGYFAGTHRNANTISSFRLGEALSAALDGSRNYAHTRAVDLRLAPIKVDFRMFGDLNEITRALKNVIINGIKYTFPWETGKIPWVTVTLQEEGRYGCVAVENWGVQSSLMKSRLEPFFMRVIGVNSQSVTRERVMAWVFLTHLILSEHITGLSKLQAIRPRMPIQSEVLISLLLKRCYHINRRCRVTTSTE